MGFLGWAFAGDTGISRQYGMSAHDLLTQAERVRAIKKASKV
jgi:hypothetical protein